MARCFVVGGWRVAAASAKMKAMRGASTRPFSPLEELLRQRAGEGAWPGAVYACGGPGEEAPFLGAVGSLAVVPTQEPARADALYDLASITKVLACGALALRFESKGLCDLDAPLDAPLPELSGYAGRTPSLVDLLSHRAGFPTWAPLYATRVLSTEDLPGSLAALEPAYEAGTSALYSCPSAIAAGLALERIGGAPLDELFRTEIAGPLGLEGDLRFGPLPDDELARCAPTERSRAREAGLVRERGRDGALAARVAPGPDLVLRGVVHDGNAAALGGVAGNAGLFGTAEAVFRLASEMAFGGSLFEGASGDRPWAVEASGPGEERSFGFQTGRSGGAPAGVLGDASIGHVGFTGTSLWMRRRPDFVAVLLTNRVHPAWKDAPIQEWRREFHARAALAGES